MEVGGKPKSEAEVWGSDSSQTSLLPLWYIESSAERYALVLVIHHMCVSVGMCVYVSVCLCVSLCQSVCLCVDTCTDTLPIPPPFYPNSVNILGSTVGHFSWFSCRITEMF